jgi:hypothetical protein
MPCRRTTVFRRRRSTCSSTSYSAVQPTLRNTAKYNPALLLIVLPFTFRAHLRRIKARNVGHDGYDIWVRPCPQAQRPIRGVGRICYRYRRGITTSWAIPYPYFPVFKTRAALGSRREYSEALCPSSRSRNTIPFDFVKRHLVRYLLL